MRIQLLQSASQKRNSFQLEPDTINNLILHDHFGHIKPFAEWLKNNRSQKRFAEWNGRIYFMSDILAGLMPDMPGLTDDLPKQSP